ncbi:MULTISPECIES: radical SAM protein [unclassified Halanaerobium]|uniref:radical SAM protein n=1 Tax=unclassified Halanaerobium TaxID=2641197 RepID=UPI000DF17586|nr:MULTISPECIES: radical SAM protein [unclassified Halanaerobium]RCW40915.1 wyosine [tRNA(Phe)-imidazoG37] synthetase (radical SAM superfamily) [Halanaerobium sp. MA284_MarDTE_T2]RCW79227.1 wyosine [tRNA(Phe)-imidazoG37] synthetase (radical SAM superfamily) [Halanaerobium sp. DL-01]
MKIFGPVPSRRLGQSLGVNIIPPKICSFSCVYCQLGRTKRMRIKREKFYEVDEVVREVKKSLKKLKKAEEKVDYLTFVADGEPTLDINLGKTAAELNKLGVKTAIITNGSLMADKNVQKEMLNFDWVSLKCDAVSTDIWKKVDRPHAKLNLEEIHKGYREFAKKFKGALTTETMLVKGINDSLEELNKIALFVSKLNSGVTYVAVPTRPPAEKDVKGPDIERVNAAVQIFKEKGINTEYLIGYEGNQFSSTGNIREDLLNITSVHPLKEEAVEELLKKCGAEWIDVEKLISEEKIVKAEFNGEDYFVRKLKD